MTLTLREIAPEIDRLWAEYNSEDCTDERREAIEAEFDQLDITLERKAEAYAALIEWHDSQAARIKAEEDRLSKKRKREEHNSTWLFNNLSACLLRLGETKLETNNYRFSFRKSEALIIQDEEKIPDTYFVPVPATRQLDKSAVKSDLKQGVPVEGAILEVRQNLQIK